MPDQGRLERLSSVTANSVMSIQRVFHRSRVGRFTVIELDSLRAELTQEIAFQPAYLYADNLDRVIEDLRIRLDPNKSSRDDNGS